MEKIAVVRFILNGEEVEARVDPQMTLLRYLRDERRLTGTKNGCSANHCGACMVLLNGLPTKSCLLKLERVAGKKVETIEGLSKPEELHPIQAAFLATGAVQCGFCTPGMIISVKGLLDRLPSPTEEQIREALRENICRCTGYIKIIEAVKLAARWIRRPEEMRSRVVETGLGRSAPDLDGKAKIRGCLTFADDMYMEGLLYGKILWSRYPHAEILSLDTSLAKKAPGIQAILTADDVPGHNGMGSLNPDQPVLCRDRVRFVGDAIAVVFAETPAAAEMAVKQIKVDYRELPGIFSPQEALRPEALPLHPGGNICKHLLHEEGNIEAGFRQAAVVVEGHFETPFVEHAYLEPEAGIGLVDENGILTIYAPTQFPFEIRKQLAAVLSLPEERIRVIATPLGGAFGSKLDNTVEALLAIGAYHLRRPVKITLTREESIRVSTKRHAYWMDYRVGLDSAGHLVAVDAKLLSDAGPYTALSPRVIDQACIFACGPYEVPNVRVEGWAMYTNNANGSAFRGFGINQAAVAIESLLDEAARKLCIDPFEIRMINALKIGDRTISGEILKVSVATQATIQAVREALPKELPAIQARKVPGKRIGVGMASGFKNVGAGKGKVDDAGAIFSLQADGWVLLRASAVDMGQGIRTVLVQVASEVLGLDDQLFDIITGDTALTIPHGGAVGERQTLITGKAVELAAREFKTKLLQKATAHYELPFERLRIRGKEIFDESRGLAIPLAELAGRIKKAGEELQVQYYYTAPKTYALADKDARRTVPPEEYRNYPSYAYTTQVAVVEVDENTGQVQVLKIIAAHDCGRAINPRKIEGQIEGSCAQGLGYALSEAYILDRGIPVTRTFKQLRVPTVMDIPDIRCILVEDPEPAGPFGAKGISEVATVPITPAILNAIYDATGVRIYTLPATPDKVLAGLRSRQAVKV
ncbi:MAG: 2Fe-2S iron-sulfur cluster binding domain-containing protein [Deltaproteobacteria bacterium]|nr:2Fe-2S iron-sulfur cluster binding domain-containing protein [Deltaproteobacteria bacterium]